MKKLIQDVPLDQIDTAILRQIQHDGRISNSELARRINLSQPATHTRIKRLETLGFIRQYVSLLNREKLGLDMICFIHIRLQAHSDAAMDQFQESIQGMPEVLECHHITGEFDFVLKVVLRNRQQLGQFVRQKMVTLNNIGQISTSVVLFEVKSTTALPLSESL